MQRQLVICNVLQIILQNNPQVSPSPSAVKLITCGIFPVCVVSCQISSGPVSFRSSLCEMILFLSPKFQKNEAAMNKMALAREYDGGMQMTKNFGAKKANRQLQSFQE